MACIASLALALSLADTASADPTGTITAPITNAQWTMGRASFSVTFDICGSDGAPTCKWRGAAFVVPAVEHCTTTDDPFSDLQGEVFVWASTEQTANGTVSSGLRQFSMSGPGVQGQKACLYFIRTFTLTGATYFFPIRYALFTVEQANPPGQPGQQALTASTAKKAATNALLDRFGKKWRKGKRKKVRCSSLAANAFECKVSWRYKGRRYAGRVVVSLDGGQVRTKVQVKKRHK